MSPGSYRKIYILIFLALAVWGQFLNAQTVFDEDEDVNTQIWLDYNPSWVLNSKTQIYGDIGARTIIPNNWYRAIVRPAIRYDLLSFNERTERYRTWQLHGGIGFFYTYNLEVTDILEIRPFQGLRVKIPNRDRLQLVHYVRLEERLELGLGEGTSEFSIRARYMIGKDFILPGKFLTQGLYLPVYAEFFFNLNTGAQFNDVMRLTPGIGYRPNQDMRFQFDLSYHRRRPSSDDKFRTNDIVFRFRVYQRF
jgi:hypothetical protein